MVVVRRIALALLVLVTPALFAQTADLEVVSASDAPDPITPGAVLTYSVTLTNHGPDPATGGGININLPGAVTHQNSVAPAGFSCNYLGNNGTCNIASLAVGTYMFTINVVVSSSLAAFPDQDIDAQFFPSGTTIDPNSGNNMKTATTTVDSPQVDLSLTATDSPDPVFPDGNVTYSVTVTNSGPDTASSVNFNVVPNPSLAFQSVTEPVGWNCVEPSVGAQNATFTCSRATWAPGTDNFTVVFSANDENFGINDTPFDTYFSVFAGASDETDDGSDNDETVTTQYSTPEADMNITASDSPDPVGPDDDITYTVTVTNQGPDAAPNARMTLVGNGGQTRFQSITAPGSWTCGMPAAGTLLNVASYDCTIPSLASGASAVFTIVTEASDDLHPNSDHNITQAFTTSSSVADGDNMDNAITVTTGFVVNDADMNIIASDSPDPVSPDGDITYTVTVTNQGPDPATNAKMTLVGNGGQTRFQSITAPGTWTCNMPAAGTLLNVTNYECTIASLANGASAVFTIVTEASDDLHPNSDHNITQNFTTSADEADPDNTDNAVTVTTAYNVPNADISVTNSDSPDPVAPGGTITYTQSITNNGPDTAANATFTQSTPAGTTFQSIVAPGWTCGTPAVGATGLISCSKASMISGESGAFTVVVNVTGTGSITSTVTGGSDASDPDPSDNTASVTTTSIAPATADLEITKTTTTTSAPAGSTYSYTITVTNHGPDAAVNVVMTDTLPSSLLFRSITEPAGFDCTTPAVGATGTITCTAATMADDATATFTLVVEVAAGASGSIVNQASADSDTADSNSGNSGASAPGVAPGPASADVSIVKSTTATAASTGSTITYTITVMNAGPSPATNVVVSDTLPASLDFVSASPSQGTCNATSPVVCNLGTLAVGASATITLQAEVVATSGTITNSASVTLTEGAGDSSTAPPVPVISAPAGVGIPTLSEWALLMLAAMIGVAALVRMRM